MCDDLFDESGDERDIQELTWKKTADGVNKDGYRAGIEAGQEEWLQDGFNSTFSTSSKLLYTVSAIRGQISGKLSYNLMKPGTLSPNQVKQLEELLQDLLEYEMDILNFSSKTYSDSELLDLDHLKTNTSPLNDNTTTNEYKTEESLPEEFEKCESGVVEKCETSSKGASLQLDDSGVLKEDKLTSENSILSKINNFKQRYKAVLESSS